MWPFYVVDLILFRGVVVVVVVVGPRPALVVVLVEVADVVVF